MSAEFLRTARSLGADGYGYRAPALVVGALLLLAWGLWLGFSSVPIFVVSERARLEVDSAVHPVAAPVAGRIVASHFRLGARVQVGDVLAELDAESERLALAEERTRLEAQAQRREALGRELRAEQQALGEARGAADVALGEARARLREAETALQVAGEEARRAERLQAEGQIALAELGRLRGEAQKRQAAADSARLAVERLGREQQAAQSDRQVRLERLHGDSASLEGEEQAARAAIERLEHAVDARRIRAPATGRLAEIGEVGVGEVVEAGRKLGSVVPDGEIRAVAEFDPQAAVGRIRPDQPARIRLDGFAWGQYGTLAARVRRVAGEVRNGRVRVELGVEPSGSEIPLEHGLPGSVEVETERVSPAVLVLRNAGKLLARPRRAERLD